MRIGVPREIKDDENRVANMPGAVPRASTYALTNVTLGQALGPDPRTRVAGAGLPGSPDNPPVDWGTVLGSGIPTGAPGIPRAPGPAARAPQWP